MAKYSKFNIVYLLQKWMDSVAGQTFMNYAYSWGAAVVILGTLFKLTHLPGANMMLFIGMGTEVFVFFISAFDRPFDKTADGMDLATDSQLAAEAAYEIDPLSQQADSSPSMGSAGAQGGIVVIGNGSPVIGGGSSTIEGVNTNDGFVEEGVTCASPLPIEGEMSEGQRGSVTVAPTPAPAVSPETAIRMEGVTTDYIERLELLNETLTKVAELSNKLSVDSEEMENLNRTLTGIARVYEMQLKSASQQITTQDSINEQTRIMAEKITELNALYARMIQAMTVNMKGAAN